MNRGFVTIATGDERYYDMARTLLRSYRQSCKSPHKFALIADRQNEYTSEFDDVIILEHPSYSWMDKLSLIKECPYEETIFIDADCLVYQDINFLWDLFSEADDFSCFGKVLPIESEEGWFKKDVQKLYQIHFITHLHGMLYFIRKSESIAEMGEWCEKIINDYKEISFKAFNDVLADEPVFALAMSIMNFKPIDRKPEYYCFVPFATKLSTDYFHRKVHYTNPKDGAVNSCFIVHWGNKNTLKYQYRADKHAVQFEQNHSKASVYTRIFYRAQCIRCWYWIKDQVKGIFDFVRWFLDRSWRKVRRILQRQG